MGRTRTFAEAIVNTFDEILTETLKHQAPKGEGSERVLRTYLKDILFVRELEWLPSKLIYGEMLDLYAYDIINYLVLYIETKTPNNISLQENEVAKFELKLQRLGTCDYGIITNGHKFVVYRCYLESGTPKTEQQFSLDLDDLRAEMKKDGLSNASVKLVSEAFNYFKYSQYLSNLEEPFSSDYGKVTPTINDPNSLSLFSRQLKQAVDALDGVFEPFLDMLYRRRMNIGGTNGNAFTIDEPLSDWSTYSGKVPPILMMEALNRTVQRLLKLRQKSQLSDAVVRRIAKDLKKNLGVDIDEDVLNSLISVGLVDERRIESAIRERLFALIKTEHVEVFSRQTAHVVLSRILLHRVSEDKNLVGRRLSGESLDRYVGEMQHGQLQAGEAIRAFQDLIDQADDLMGRVFYSHLYAHGLFDWWRIPEDIQRFLDESDKIVLRRHQRSINLSLLKVLRILNRFNMIAIERDVWKDIYQNYLPPKERSRLGGFYTPDEIVTLILDLVGYKSDAQNLCNAKILDPACGSGTFAVEAARRLRQHLETPAECHRDISRITDDREKSWHIMQKILQNIYGIDIHPFACFLTEMNFLFLLVDLLLTSKQIDPQRRIDELNFGCDDSLRPSDERIQLTLTPFVSTNSRARLVVQDKAKANKIKEMKFQFVVGNPPWSGVLRGALSPLFDETIKQVYKNKYESSTDKYDIYVLFLERGIRWLENKGVVGLVTQNRYFRRRYGRGVRGVIKKFCKALYLMDLGHVGKTLFPGRTNYPAISVYYKVSSPDKDEFVFLETKKTAKRLKIDELAGVIRQTIDSISQNEYESENALVYKLPQAVLKGDPNLPWSLVPPRENLIKKTIYTTRSCKSLVRICDLAQGVTPGGGCLDIYLVRGNVAKTLEVECLRPAVEADDVKTWALENAEKWLIYPYDEAGKEINFGKLDINLTQERALSEIDKRIVSGEIAFPKTAEYLVSHFARLSQRIFEKKTLSDFGKNWYEYHRPRDGNLLCRAPKIVTRRMTKEVEFSLDADGVLPTDGCIAIIPRSKNAVVEHLVSLGMEQDEALDTANYYLLSLLNSSIVKFLLKSTADFWQGNFYQVREEFLDLIPVRIPDKSCFEEIKEIVALAKMVTHGEDSKIAEIEKSLLKLYKLESKEMEIQQFLATRK